MAQDVQLISGSDARVAARLCNFSTSYATLLPSHIAWLDSTVKPIVIALPSPYVEIIGYASHLGNHLANKQLSVARCESVRIRVAGYNPKTSVKREDGKGDEDSTGDAADNAGYWRAVEVYVYNAVPFGPPPPPEAPAAAPPTVYTPGTNHNHQPSGKWEQVQANPNSPGANPLHIAACKTLPPAGVAGLVRTQFIGKPIALKHLDWYLKSGHGRDFVEDANIKLMLQTDAGMKGAIGSRIHYAKTGKFAGHFMVAQTVYSVEDFQYAFGAIDRLDFEADFDAGTIHVWFQDRYDWHPVYPGLYTKLPGDEARSTNFVHAAMVELKASGARDFWMKGEATVPLTTVAPTWHK